MPPNRTCDEPRTVTIQLNPGMTAVDVSNAVYKLASAIFETYGEHDPNSGVRGNGHHMAQKLAEDAEGIWIGHGGKRN
jgi:hypothetical protein